MVSRFADCVEPAKAAGNRLTVSMRGKAMQDMDIPRAALVALFIHYQPIFVESHFFVIQSILAVWRFADFVEEAMAAGNRLAVSNSLIAAQCKMLAICHGIVHARSLPINIFWDW